MQLLLLLNMNTLKFARQLAMFALLAASSLASATEAEERGAVRDQAAESYRAGDFAELEKQHSLYSNFFEQRTSSGAFKMTLFFDGIDAAMREADEKELQNDIARTKSWVNSQRASPLAHVLHARALLSYGAYFRGGGFANTVPPQAWKVYEEFTRKAGTYLIENEQVASRSTSWHAWMLNIARIAGMPQEAIQRVFLAGLSVNSADYRLYRNALEYALPKWHGSPEAVDAFVQMAVKSAPPKYGSELYARLYSATEQDQFGRRLYEDSLVDWKQMKEGLTAWAQNFPTQWNKNILAYHACIAGDKPFAKELLAEIGENPQWNIWEPRAKATFDTCVRWAADPKAEPTQPRTRNARAGTRS